jgi:hypothetical protein
MPAFLSARHGCVGSKVWSNFRKKNVDVLGLGPRQHWFSNTSVAVGTLSESGWRCSLVVVVKVVVSAAAPA